MQQEIEADGRSIKTNNLLLQDHKIDKALEPRFYLDYVEKDVAIPKHHLTTTNSISSSPMLL